MLCHNKRHNEMYIGDGRRDDSICDELPGHNIIYKKRNERKIYKPVFRPLMTQAAETRSDKAKIKKMLETAKSKILRKIDKRHFGTRQGTRSPTQMSGEEH